ncbi:thioredoxin domain-containing protein [bacterium]|nr:thioredoxin domain-containing protein [bacterium]
MRLTILPLLILLFTSCQKGEAKNNQPQPKSGEKLEKVEKNIAKNSQQESLKSTNSSAEILKPAESLQKVTSSTAIGVFDGKSILLSDLEKEYPNLFSQQDAKTKKELHQFYELATTQYAMKKMLEGKAKEEKLANHQELLDKITEKTVEPSKEDVETFYKKYESALKQQGINSIQEAEETIKTYLKDSQKQEIALKYVEDLKKNLNFKTSFPKANLPKISIDLKDAPILGDPKSSIILTIVSDFQCPFCAKAATLIHDVNKKYPNIAIAFKHFPLDFHPLAKRAAIASNCALKEGKFWEYHDSLFSKQSEISEELFLNIADSLSLNKDKFKACLDSKEELTKLENEIKSVESLEIQGTPTMFLNGSQIEAFSIEQLSAAIDSELSGEKPKPLTNDLVVASFGSTNITWGEVLKENENKIKMEDIQQLQKQKEFLTQTASRYVSEKMLNLEAKAKGLDSIQKYMESVLKDVPTPTDDELKTTYEQFKSKLGGASFEQVKDKLKAYQLQMNQQGVARKLMEELYVKYKVLISIPEPELPSIEINLKNAPSIGKKDAPHTLIVFSDFECPYCSKFSDVLEKVQKEYPEKVAVYFKHFPLSFHQNALPASIASFCAQKQGKFWEYHNKLFASQGNFNDSNYVAWAEELKLDKAEFEKCIKSAEAKNIILSELQEGQDIGIQGTPTFYLDGKPYNGSFEVEAFKDLLK